MYFNLKQCVLYSYLSIVYATSHHYYAMASKRGIVLNDTKSLRNSTDRRCDLYVYIFIKVIHTERAKA